MILFNPEAKTIYVEILRKATSKQQDFAISGCILHVQTVASVVVVLTCNTVLVPFVMLVGIDEVFVAC